MNKGNLLLVDDEPLILKNLKFSLTSYADSVFLAADGQEALNILENAEIHCILCDVNMPRMNGLELIKKVRELGNDVPFIFFTGHGNKEMMIEVARYGAFDFIDKPYFDGVEEVVCRGLRVGLKLNAGLPPLEFVSEYQKLLTELNGNGEE
ncbi:MAG TPA: response regulator [Bacteriovoracaceae bacterium]|nr:response regulator [Bacteriovoracaceae bacterium]